MPDSAGRPIERVAVGVLTTLMAAGIGWIAYTQTQILQEQAKQAAQFDGLIFRLAFLEARLGADYFLPRAMAEQEHRAMRGNINHNWEVIQRLDVRLQAVESHRWSDATVH